MTDATRPAPSPIVPHLIVRDAAAAIAFYKRAFGAEETIRLPAPDGRILHAGLVVNGAPVMLADEMPNCGYPAPRAPQGSPVSLHLTVPDVDAAFARALAAGATTVLPVADMFWGERFGQVMDPFGHRWSLATPRRTLTEAEIRAAAAAAMAAMAERPPVANAPERTP